MSAYTKNGFKNRHEYLANLAGEYGLDLNSVVTLAEVLGPDEDFDGLLFAIEDYSFMDEEESCEESYQTMEDYFHSCEDDE